MDSVPTALLSALLALGAGLLGLVWGQRRGRRRAERAAALALRRLERDALAAVGRAAEAEAVLEGLGQVADLALLRVDAGRRLRWMNQVAGDLWPVDLTRPPSLTSALGSGALDPLLDSLADDQLAIEGVQLRERRFLVGALRLAQGDVLLGLRDTTRQEQLARAGRDLIANVSHDLRTPLTSIGLLVDALEPGRPVPERSAQALRQQVAVLRRLAEDLIQLDRLERGRAPFLLSSQALAPLVEHAAEAFGPQLAQAGLTIDCQIPPGLRVLADPDQLRRVLNNLLENAVQVSPEGGVITLRAAPAADDQVLVQVIDEGSGIPPHDLGRIFERFYRGDRARGQTGSGLGLAIVKHIVEGHGGSVEAANNPERGATVRFSLPAG